MKHRVLLIQDSPESQEWIAEVLERVECSVTTLSDADLALQTVEAWSSGFHLVIIEEAMGGRAGHKLLRAVHQRRRDLPVVMLSREGDWDGYAQALSEGATEYLAEPVNTRQLIDAVEEALAQTP